VTLQTSDPVQKVADFYQSNGVPCSVKDGKAQGFGPTRHGNMVIIDASPSGGATEISIKVKPSER